MRTIVVALLIGVLALPTRGLAQSQPRDPDSNGTPPPESVRLQESIREAIDRESLRVSMRPAGLAQQQPRERSWPGRHPVLFGALLGAGIGVVVEAAVIPGESGGEPHSVYLPMFGVIGAGIGSLTGLIVSLARR